MEDIECTVCAEDCNPAFAACGHMRLRTPMEHCMTAIEDLSHTGLGSLQPCPVTEVCCLVEPQLLIIMTEAACCGCGWANWSR